MALAQRQSAAATVVGAVAARSHRPRKVARGNFLNSGAREKSLEIRCVESHDRHSPRDCGDGRYGGMRARIAAHMRRSPASRLAGSGSPWARTELSSATTARPSLRAAATSGWSRTFTNPSRVIELFRLLGHHEFALACIGIEHGQNSQKPFRRRKCRTSCRRRASRRSRGRQLKTEARHWGIRC